MADDDKGEAQDKPKERKRMVVEEVSDTPEENKETAPSPNAQPAEEIKEKVEELQEITEHMGEDVEKSADVQEELAEAADKVTEKPAEPKTYTSAPPFSAKSKGPNPLIIIIPGILILGAILGGVYFYQRNLSNTGSTQDSTFENTATPAPQATTEPSASPSAKLDLTKYTITVQNGSGVAGTASSAKDLLIKEGFKVGSTGNADNYDYTETIIKAKANVPKEYLEKLETALSGVYDVGDNEKLADSAKEDVIVIVGSSKAR